MNNMYVVKLIIILFLILSLIISIYKEWNGTGVLIAIIILYIIGIHY